MNEYGVVQWGEYLVSLPGGVLYLVSLSLAVLLAWGLTADDFSSHFRLTRFAILSVLLLSLVTLLWTQLGVWFYVKA